MVKNINVTVLMNNPDIDYLNIMQAMEELKYTRIREVDRVDCDITAKFKCEVNLDNSHRHIDELLLKTKGKIRTVGFNIL